MDRSFKRHFLFLLIILIITLVSCDSGEDKDSDASTPQGMDMEDVPMDLDTSTRQKSDEGHYEVTLTSELDPLALNQIHSWILHVESASGEPVEEAEIVIGGGMPEHDHGFPTEPEVTEELGEGDYRVEGVKFSMAGWWEMRFDISAGDQSDSVTFNVILPQ